MLPWKPSVKVSFSAIGSMDEASPWYDQWKVLAAAPALKASEATRAAVSAACLKAGKVRIALMLRVVRGSRGRGMGPDPWRSPGHGVAAYDETESGNGRHAARHARRPAGALMTITAQDFGFTMHPTPFCDS